jgi:alpha-glucosidase
LTQWWRDATIYQIYPRSFQDTTGNGIGDLAGIRERLGYLQELGVGAVWLSPIFTSPMRDFGYDISDYRAISPLFGDMAAFDELLEAAHGQGLKLLLDFVPNHSSDQHPWFIESGSSRDAPKRDWYIWKDPAPGGGPPNNWISNFGGSAWEWDEHTRQYYYHAFLASQPDLNWRNPDVRRAMHDVLRFWLDKGVDGFRIDVVWHLAKDPEFRDNPTNPGWDPSQPEIQRHLQQYSADQPFVHEIIEELREVIEAYNDRLLIGEIYLPLDRLVAYYGRDNAGLHLPFNFQLITSPWRGAAIRDLIEEYEAAIPVGGWPNWVLSNHDQPRIAARVGQAQARVAAMMLLTLRGTPTLYYGDEIGMGDVHIPADRIKDPWAVNEPEACFIRDKARTPMQWSAATAHAGFSSGDPWLPLTADWESRNVRSQQDDGGSMLALHRALLALRAEHEDLLSGDFRPVAAAESVVAYRRGDRIAVALNLSSDPADLAWPDDCRGGRVLLRASSCCSGGEAPHRIDGDEGLVILLDGGGR